MKQWSGAGFPLTLILTLAALTAWLRHAAEVPEGGDGRHRHDPDYIVDGARITRLDALGNLRYTMRAERIVHFPDDDSTEITRPHLVYLNDRRPPTTMAAQRAHVSADGAIVRLDDKVEVRREASKQRAELLARMDRLTVYPDEERATTDAAVEITEGASWLRGTGMDFDNNAQLFVLKSAVTGKFEPRRSRTSGRP